MSRTITAEYLAEEQKLKLDAPLEGVCDHEKVTISLARPLRDLANSLSSEAGRELADAVQSAFDRDRS